MISRRSAGSGIVPSGASRRAWSWPSARAPGRRMTSAAASATPAAGATLHAPPATMTRSGGGRASKVGVAARRRWTAALAAARRSSAPSPAASPHGARASSRSRSRTRRRSSEMLSQPMMASRCASPNPRGRSAASATIALGVVTGSTASLEPARGGAAATRAPADWPISMTSTRRPRTSASVVVAAASARRPSGPSPRSESSRIAQRRPAALRGRRRRHRGARAVGRHRRLHPAARLGQPADEHGVEVGAALGRGRDDRDEVRDQRPLVAARGLAAAGQHGRDRRVGERAGDRRGSPRRRARAAARASRPPWRPRRAAPARASWRRRTAISGGGEVAHATWGRSSAEPGACRPTRGGEVRIGRRRGGARRRSSESLGGRRRRARRSPRAGASARPTCPIREAAIVAVPRSTAAKARGSLLTDPILPDCRGRPGPATVAGSPSGVPAVGLVQLLEPVDQRLDPGVVAQQLARRRDLAAEQLAQHRVEEQHRGRAERPVRPAGLEEVHRRARSGRAGGSRARRPRPAPRDARRRAPSGSSLGWPRCGGLGRAAAWRAPARRRTARARRPRRRPRRAARRSRARSTTACAARRGRRRPATRAASSRGKPPMPVPSAGNATLVQAQLADARHRARAAARSMAAALVRRSRSRDTAWMTTLAASRPAGVTTASPSSTGAWRTAANSIASPPVRLSSPATPVDIHSDVEAGLTMASTSRSQMSPFQSSMRATRTSRPRASGPPPVNRRHGTPGAIGGTST